MRWLNILKRSAQPTAALQPPVLPSGQRLYVVGDVHGRHDLLTQLLTLILADAAGFTGQLTLVMLGDYLNRGPHSAQVLGLLANRAGLPSHWQLVLLRGNHEQALLEFLAEPETRAEWLYWGGQETLRSYGIPPLDAHARLRPAGALAAELQEALTQHGHLALLNSTQMFHQQAPYLCVHAGVRPGVPLSQQLESDLLFIREDWWHTPHRLPHIVVFGHTIVPQPHQTEDRIGIDTGAYQSGILTAVVLEGETRRFLHTTPPTSSTQTS